MSPIQAWAKWTIVAAGVLFSPAFAFLLALAAAYFVVGNQGDRSPRILTIVGVCVIAFVLVRASRRAAGRDAHRPRQDPEPSR